MRAKIFYAATFKSLTNQINKSGAALRVDCHFNSSPSSDPNYSLTEVREGDRKSFALGYELSKYTAINLKIRSSGVRELSPGQRGYPIVRDMNCPVLLWEPCFCSNPSGADIIKNKRYLLHDAFMETINRYFEPSALIALVPGHAHKKRGDPGASVWGGGTEAKYTELLCQELFSLINSKPVEVKGDEEEMITKEGTIHVWHVRVDNQNEPWLNLGNDTSAPIEATIVVCPSRNEDDPDTSVNSEPLTKKIPSYAPRDPGINIRELARMNFANFSGIVMVTAKGAVPFSSSIETLKR